MYRRASAGACLEGDGVGVLNAHATAAERTICSSMPPALPYRTTEQYLDAARHMIRAPSAIMTMGKLRSARPLRLELWSSRLELDLQLIAVDADITGAYASAVDIVC